MSESSQLQKIEQIAGKKSSKYPSKQHPEQQKNRNNPHILKECNFCGKSHEAIKTKCPPGENSVTIVKAETILKSSARKYIHWRQRAPPMNLMTPIPTDLQLWKFPKNPRHCSDASK
jgi:hypothetical protein